jgi:hypothetical protein
MQTPWGKSQYSRKIATGIMFYGTAGHGGLHISEKKNQCIPDYMRNENGWYEEDCESAIPMIVFTVFDNNQKIIAEKTLKNYFPKMYEKFFNTIIPAGESYAKDELLWWEEHKNEYIAVSVSPVSEIDVIVTACIGGRNPESYNYCGQLERFIVPKQDYNNHHFVIDTTKYKKVA